MTYDNDIPFTKAQIEQFANILIVDKDHREDDADFAYRVIGEIEYTRKALRRAEDEVDRMGYRLEVVAAIAKRKGDSEQFFDECAQIGDE